MSEKKFNEELEKIRNYTELSEVSKVFDFMYIAMDVTGCNYHI